MVTGSIVAWISKELSSEPSLLSIVLFGSIRWSEPKHGIVLFGEIIGRGVQKGMEYGCAGRSFRVFDLAIIGRYLGHEEESRLFDWFGVEAVPIPYRGDYSRQVLNEFTDGPTTMASTEELGKFKGRKGIEITPVRERPDDEAMLLTGTRGAGSLQIGLRRLSRRQRNF